jgi:hypothetical protein
MSVDNIPIIISAPAGSLGRHLAALVDYAVNAQTDVLELTKPAASDIAVTVQEFVAPTVQPLSPLQFWHWDYAPEDRIPVFYTTQDPADIAKDYPTGRIIQITTEVNDATQLAYNYLIVEQWRATGQIADTQYINEVKTMLGETSVSLADIFSDSQFMDNLFVQALIERVASSRVTTASGPESRANLILTFQDICYPANTADNTNIQPLLNFLDSSIRSDEEIYKLWHTFVRSLHYAKRNILNTANWS